MRIVKEKLNGKIMAMKKLKKAEMLRRGQVEHVKAERNVLAEVHNPYIVKLYYSFQVTARLLKPLQYTSHQNHAARWACMCIQMYMYCENTLAALNQSDGIAVLLLEQSDGK